MLTGAAYDPYITGYTLRPTVAIGRWRQFGVAG